MQLSKPKMALIGLILVVLVAIVPIILLSGDGGDGGDTDEPDTPVAGPVAAKDLTVGTCVRDANTTTGNVMTFHAVSCDKPHDGEVFTIIELEGTRYPGVEFVTGKGQRGCRARLRRQATAKAFRDRLLGYKFVYPTRESWAQGDHEVTCLATFRKPRTGKLAQRAADDS